MTPPFAGLSRLLVFWLFGYAFAIVMAVVLQKLVMPVMPALHAGHGLLSHDAIVFHDMAVAMADRIVVSGWGEWELIPGNGITANVGILAAVYAVFGPDPAWFIPLNAGFHSLGALLVLRLGTLLIPGKSGWTAGGQSTSPINSGVSGQSAIGAGIKVSALYLIGAFGLLVRDLLLINRTGFTTSLDSFYLAMMIPMLLVGILAVPLGAALVVALHQAKRREDVQSLISATCGASLLVFGLLFLIALAAMGPFARGFVVNGDVPQVVMLMSISMLLVLFAGLVVTGNSLLNSLGKPVWGATAQLVVPLIAVGTVLVVPEVDLIVMAIVAMVFGQAFNLAILYAIACKEGYHLYPAALFKMLPRLSAPLASYSWLVVAAMLINLVTPLNYWFASRLGEGSVSTWAVGSKLVQMFTVMGAGLLSAVWVPYLSKLVTAGVQVRIRKEMLLTVTIGSWSGGVLSLIVFAFCGPFIMAAMPAVQDAVRAGQLIAVVQLGALQLPLFVVSLLLMKLSAAVEVSWRVVLATSSGLLVNALLGYAWLPVWGVSGVAAAWSLSTLLSTLIILFATRTQTHLGLGEIFSVVASWLVIGAVALAVYLDSLAVVAVTLLVFSLVLIIQIRLLWRMRTVSDVHAHKLA